MIFFTIEGSDRRRLLGGGDFCDKGKKEKLLVHPVSEERIYLWGCPLVSPSQESPCPLFDGVPGFRSSLFSLLV